MCTNAGTITTEYIACHVMSEGIDSTTTPILFIDCSGGHPRWLMGRPATMEVAGQHNTPLHSLCNVVSFVLGSCSLHGDTTVLRYFDVRRSLA